MPSMLDPGNLKAVIVKPGRKSVSARTVAALRIKVMEIKVKKLIGINISENKGLMNKLTTRRAAMVMTTFL